MGQYKQQNKPQVLLSLKADKKNTPVLKMVNSGQKDEETVRATV